MLRLPIVGVIGSGSDPHSHLAEPLGRLLADEGVHLLTGGGGGVMTSVSRAFASKPQRRGMIIGILPGSVHDDHYSARPGYPNEWIELPIFTHLPLSGITGTSAMSRNHINILSSHVIITLPGGAGTLSELRLAHQYNKPILAFMNEDDHIEGWDETMVRTTDPWQARRFLREHLRSVGQ